MAGSPTYVPSQIADIVGLPLNMNGTALANWRDRTSTRKLCLVGDSTFDSSGPSPQIYTELALLTVAGGPLDGVTVQDFGSSGNSLVSWLAGGGSTGKLLANLPTDAAGVILRYGINDTRTGANTEDQLTALMIAEVDAVAARCPTATIALMVPNAFTLDDVGAAGYVVPNSSAQAYSTLMRNATIRAWQARPYCVLMDLQADVLGRTCRNKQVTSGTSALMADQLHPSFAAQTVIADYIAAVFDVRPDVAPYLGSTRKYSPFLSRAAQIEFYQAPWTVYPWAVYDSARYTILFEGYVGNSGSTFIDIYNVTGNPVAAKLASYLGGSAILVTRDAKWAVNAYIDQVGYLRASGSYSTPPTIGTPIVIARHKFARDAVVEAAFVSPVNRYRRTGYTSALAGDTSWIEITGDLPEGTPSNLWTAATTTDTLVISAGAFSGQYSYALTGCTFTYPSANVLRITKTAGFFTAGTNGAPCAIYGTHEMEVSLAQTRLVGPRLVVWGDSITAGSTSGLDTDSASTPQQQFGQSYANLVGVLAGDRVRLIHNAGIPGETSDTILSRFATGVAPFRPDVVLILAGTNDVSGSLALAQSQANIRAMVAKCQSIGALPILQTIPPKYTTTAALQSQLQQLNIWIRAYAATNRFPLVDQYAALVDPKLGQSQTKYTVTLANATGGTFTITFGCPIQQGSYAPSTGSPIKAVKGALTTSGIAYNATSQAVSLAIFNASGVGQFMHVEGPAGGPYQISVPEQFPFVITANGASLTGSTPTVTVANGNQYCVDGTHPTMAAQVVMAQAVTTLLQTLYPPNSLLPTMSDNKSDPNAIDGQSGSNPFAIADVTSLTRDGCFNYLSASGGTLPGFWSPSGTGITYSLLKNDSTILGNWMQGQCGGSLGYFAFQSLNIGTTVAIGDTVAFVGRLSTSGFAATNIINYQNTLPNSYGAQLIFVGSSGNQFVCPFNAWCYDVTGNFYVEAVVPAGTTSITADVIVQGPSSTPTIKISQCAVINLTRLGLVTP